MTEGDAERFPIEPWALHETYLDFERLAQSESLFALSNGHIGVRGNLDEGDPSGLPGTYLNSFYEKRPLPYAEAGYGFPEEGQSVVNVTDGKLIRLLVDDEPFDLRYGTLLNHERILDFKTGLLHRNVHWRSPAGREIKVRSTRLVSFTQRAIVAVHYEVEAVGPTRIVIQSELVANEETPRLKKDPRVAAMMEKPLEPQEFGFDGTRALLLHRTKVSNLRMAAAMDHKVSGTDRAATHTYGEKEWARTTVGARLDPGETLQVSKFVAYGWSSQRTLPALRDQVDAALSAVLYTGWDTLVAEQKQYVADYWDGADIEIDGDPVVQQAVRFGMFHVLQAGARSEGRAIPAKGMTGPGYDGHAFWDTEMFVLPVLTATAPDAVADALRWRHSTLDLARERAADLHLRGAAFPWRTIRGQECSGYWPAGTAAFHINADIAEAVRRYVHWTGDAHFERDVAFDILVETARLWMTVGFTDHNGMFHVHGVTGPDEYSAVVDDNVYTNLAAASNLRWAAAAARRWPERHGDLDVSDEEIESWERASSRPYLPFDERLDVFKQDAAFTDHEVWDFQRTHDDDKFPLLLNYPYFDIYRKQVIKQADLILAMHWFGSAFTAEQKAKAFAYYEPLTVRDSSLSACTQAVISAEVGHLELAHDYLSEAALMDLRDLEHNTGDGLHIASLAGAWLVLVAGFGGLRDDRETLDFAPRLPAQIKALSFSVRWWGCRVRVRVEREQATYRLEDGPDATFDFRHHGETFTLRSGQPVTLPIGPITPLTPRPQQPAGRGPVTAFQS